MSRPEKPQNTSMGEVEKDSDESFILLALWNIVNRIVWKYSSASINKFYGIYKGGNGVIENPRLNVCSRRVCWTYLGLTGKGQANNERIGRNIQNAHWVMYMITIGAGNSDCGHSRMTFPFIWITHWGSHPSSVLTTVWRRRMYKMNKDEDHHAKRGQVVDFQFFSVSPSVFLIHLSIFIFQLLATAHNTHNTPNPYFY